MLHTRHGCTLLCGALLVWASPGWANTAEGKADSPSVETAVQPTAGYHKGFFIRGMDGLFELRIQGRVQARYTLEVLEHEDDETAFSIPRARLTLAGHALTKALRYKFQTDFGKGFVTLKERLLRRLPVRSRVAASAGRSVEEAVFAAADQLKRTP